jgi:hypothetical protein
MPWGGPFLWVALCIHCLTTSCPKFKADPEAYYARCIAPDLK